MNRIDKTLADLKQAGKKALVPYIVAGDPVKSVTLLALHAMSDAGADIIELGVPFSDPMAEGPVIQRAHERALANNMSLRAVLDIVAEFRQTNQHTPIVLMGYANPVERMGYQKFAQAAAKAGVDGVLTVDLPPEEAVDFDVQLKAEGIESIFLIAPTTKVAREKMIVELASGYLYYVSLKGVTGAGHLDIDSVREKMAEIKLLTSLPVCVGFGIKDGVTAKAVCSVADGAVVGSVVVDAMANAYAGGQQDPEQIASSAATIIKEIRTAIDNPKGSH